MSRIFAHGTALLGKLLAFGVLTGCAGYPAQPIQQNREASDGEVSLRARLEQTLFNDLVTQGISTENYLGTPEQVHDIKIILERDVDLRLISNAQRQLFSAIAGHAKAQVPPPEARIERDHQQLTEALNSRLNRLSTARAALGRLNPELLVRVGPSELGQQQFLDLVDSAIAVQLASNPFALDYTQLPSLLIKRYHLPTHKAFFYQTQDSSIRLNPMLLSELSFAEAEVIAFLAGLPGKHFLTHRRQLPAVFPKHRAANQTALTLLMLEAADAVAFYQVDYSRAVRLNHLLLVTAQQLKAINVTMTFDEFVELTTITGTNPARLQAAFAEAAEAPEAFERSARALLAFHQQLSGPITSLPIHVLQQEIAALLPLLDVPQS